LHFRLFSRLYLPILISKTKRSSKSQTVDLVEISRILFKSRGKICSVSSKGQNEQQREIIRLLYIAPQHKIWDYSRGKENHIT